MPHLAAIDPEPVGSSGNARLQIAASHGQGLTLSEVYASHAALAWRALRRLGVPEAGLEDALQDVFLVVHRRLAEFEGRACLTTWIYGIVLRVAKDHRRSEARHHARVERLAQLDALDRDRTPDPAHAAECRQANALMHLLLAKLPNELRDILVLVELEELPMREACQSLGVTMRTGQRRLRAARRDFDALLATHLQADGRSSP